MSQHIVSEIMLSKAKQKWIRQLELKKFRQENGLFLAEGRKLVGDLLPLLSCRYIAATPAWWSEHPGTNAAQTDTVSEEELRQTSGQHCPQEVLAVFEIPRPEIDWASVSERLSLALDNVQDPGNLGTIIRTADWFGIEDIFCSIGTVDAYHPKCVQASMGAIGRVRIHYLPIDEVIRRIDAPVYGTFLDGEDIYCAPLSPNGLILMGNEGNGVSPQLAQRVEKRLFIPNYPLSRKGSESLNVSVATAIVCSEFRRR